MAQAKPAGAKPRPAADKPKREGYKPDPAFLEAQRRAKGEERRTQVHLAGAGHSWRGVRLRDLGPSERRKAERDAAAEVGPDASLMALHDRIVDECLRRMIVEVTAEPVEELNGSSRWEPYTLAALSQPGVWDRLFTSRDDTWLRRWYQTRHEVTQAEIEMITGKAVPVAPGD